ncbi:hypothetical protein PGT21_014578 [Puccinia graminis f. sp. tritici]|uniref:Uncharacterized protein n=1 Tax=Puccinia graminis f. sp. tritici TaxID=56615 RepID=A0A5B0NSJ9_PUCGR|nr:hypothetical protein PGT21_014578 [Puccinia graminis f. sp. tritici]
MNKTSDASLQLLQKILNHTLSTLPGLENLSDQVERMMAGELEDAVEKTQDAPDSPGSRTDVQQGIQGSANATANKTVSITAPVEMNGTDSQGRACETYGYITLSATTLTTLSTLFQSLVKLEKTVSKDGNLTRLGAGNLGGSPPNFDSSSSGGGDDVSSSSQVDEFAEVKASFAAAVAVQVTTGLVTSKPSEGKQGMGILQDIGGSVFGNILSSISGSFGGESSVDSSIGADSGVSGDNDSSGTGCSKSGGMSGLGFVTGGGKMSNRLASGNNGTQVGADGSGSGGPGMGGRGSGSGASGSLGDAGANGLSGSGGSTGDGSSGHAGDAGLGSGSSGAMSGAGSGDDGCACQSDSRPPTHLRIRSLEQ